MRRFVNPSVRLSRILPALLLTVFAFDRIISSTMDWSPYCDHSFRGLMEHSQQPRSSSTLREIYTALLPRADQQTLER